MDRDEARRVAAVRKTRRQALWRAHLRTGAEPVEKHRRATPEAAEALIRSMLAVFTSQGLTGLRTPAHLR